MTAAKRRPRILPRQMITARDGVELCTDVYLPETDAGRPAIVVRTPYGRTTPFLMRLALRLTRAGFCAVLQDCRGRYRSGGSFDLLSETNDSRDSLTWLARQPWCDGRAGLVGLSISGLPNLMVASEPPADGVRIEALVNIMGAVDYHSMCYRNGALVHHWALPWITMMGSENMGRQRWRELDWDEVFRHLPLIETAGKTGGNEEFWRLVVSYPSYGGFWEELSATDRLGGVKAPVLHLSGWQDFMLDQTLLCYSTLAAHSGGEPDRQKLVIGPWDHRTLFLPRGAEQAGWSATEEEGSMSLTELLLRWFERWLGESGRGPAGSRALAVLPEALLHVTGTRSWIGLDTFPPREAAVQDWFLTSGGRANGAATDGRLVREAPAAMAADSYDYDPLDPVPTAGGAIWPFPSAGLVPGAADQSEIETRSDVLVFTSEVLSEDLIVLGSAQLELWATTSARDTDFTGKLVEVDSRGVPRVVQDGILRGRFRHSREREELLEPQRLYRFDIPLGSMAYRFRAGHRLRLEVSSSNFPKFDRNLNTAGPLHRATASMLARQTVFHGGERASRLRLPVIPADALHALEVDLS
ncbi:MAG: CocE/NonD family hydrolase [bacterium]|nr:CocE/NonD family hydrolase [bacterium]